MLLPPLRSCLPNARAPRAGPGDRRGVCFSPFFSGPRRLPKDGKRPNSLPGRAGGTRAAVWTRSPAPGGERPPPSGRRTPLPSAPRLTDNSGLCESRWETVRMTPVLQRPFSGGSSPPAPTHKNRFPTSSGRDSTMTAMTATAAARPPPRLSQPPRRVAHVWSSPSGRREGRPWLRARARPPRVSLAPSRASQAAAQPPPPPRPRLTQTQGREGTAEGAGEPRSESRGAAPTTPPT